MASLPPVLSIPRFGSVEKPEPDMIELIRYAGDSGVTFLHTSDVYGPHMNEILIGKVGDKEPHDLNLLQN